LPSFFDLYQKRRLFAHTPHQNPLPVQKNAVPLHRQKDKRITKTKAQQGQKNEKPQGAKK
jgi:hypothetical protein